MDSTTSTADAAALPVPPEDPTANMDASQLFAHLWGTKYAPAINEQLGRDQAHREEAFVDITWTVAGEEIRLMTAKDLALLDGFENPFVRIGSRLPDVEDCIFFLWHLNAENRGRRLMNAVRRGRCAARVASRDLAMTVAEIEEYCDRVFVDVYRGGDEGTERKPSSVAFMASLLVEVAGYIGGAIDPMSGKLLGETPIPRLLQYARASHVAQNGKEAATSFDSQRSRCLEEVNQILAQRRETKG